MPVLLLRFVYSLINFQPYHLDSKEVVCIFLLFLDPHPVELLLFSSPKEGEQYTPNSLQRCHRFGSNSLLEFLKFHQHLILPSIYYAFLLILQLFLSQLHLIAASPHRICNFCLVLLFPSSGKKKEGEQPEIEKRERERERSWGGGVGVGFALESYQKKYPQELHEVSLEHIKKFQRVLCSYSNVQKVFTRAFDRTD